MPEIAQTIFSLVSVPLAAFFAAYFGYLFASRSSRNEAINRFKEEKFGRVASIPGTPGIEVRQHKSLPFDIDFSKLTHSVPFVSINL